MKTVLQRSHSRRALANNRQCRGVRNGASWTLVGSQDTHVFLWILMGFNRDMPCTCATRQFVLGSLHAPERVIRCLPSLAHARDGNCERFFSDSREYTYRAVLIHVTESVSDSLPIVAS